MTVTNTNAAWRDAVAPFERPSLGRSLGQLATSILPYLGLWVAMAYSLRVGYWLTLLLALPAAGFLVRSFIVVHDCGHSAFFRSKRANRWTAFWVSLPVFLPAYRWSREHAKHHATAGDLDKRGSGDIWTLTVTEYRALSRWRRLGYRMYRHPLVLLVLGPIFTFILRYRLPDPGDDARSQRSTWFTNLALGAIITAIVLVIGWKAYLAIQIPVIFFAGVIGVWLFYVQHQFEGVEWRRRGSWRFVAAALRGSSYYRLPRWLQWFSGNIGFHHVHHLNPLVPNYFLESCHGEHRALQQAPVITLRSSLRCLELRLWDEANQRLVGFAALREEAARAG